MNCPASTRAYIFGGAQSYFPSIRAIVRLCYGLEELSSRYDIVEVKIVTESSSLEIVFNQNFG